MKTQSLFLLMLLLLCSTTVQSQFLKKLSKKAQEAAERTLERKVEEKTEEETSKAFDTVVNSPKKVKIGKKNSKRPEKTENKIENQKENTPEMIVGSNFFPEGEVIFEEYFENDAQGDFPALWETNAGGEVISAYDGKAMRLYPNGHYIAKTEPLPENYALEFYLITDQLDYKGLTGSLFQVVFSNERTLNKPKTGGSFGFSLWKGSDIPNALKIENWGKVKTKIDNTVNYQMVDKLNGIMQFTLVVNGSRLRVYIDNEKAIDLPNFLNEGMGRYIQFYLKGTDTQKNHVVALANVIVTKEGEDLRSKLLKGGFSTTKILFNSGSAELKSKSYDFLDQLGKTLESDSSLNIKIIGHTDSDGNDNLNLQLSDKRAKSVAGYLIENFKLSPSRIQTEGMGESQPVADNTTPEGKAQNRRVEFKKM